MMLSQLSTGTCDLNLESYTSTSADGHCCKSEGASRCLSLKPRSHWASWYVTKLRETAVVGPHTRTCVGGRAICMGLAVWAPQAEESIFPSHSAESVSAPSVAGLHLSARIFVPSLREGLCCRVLDMHSPLLWIQGFKASGLGLRAGKDLLSYLSKP